MRWDEQQTMKQILEGGFELTNQLFLSLIKCFMKDPEDKESQEQASRKEQDPLLKAIKNYKIKVEQAWPEVIRILINDNLKNPEALPLTDQMKHICN